MKLILRILPALLLVELVALARARAPFGAWLPDFALALVAAIALLGRREIVVSSTVVLALLRLPASMAEPMSAFGATLAFGLLVLETRRYFFREHPAVLAGVGFVGALLVGSAAVAAERARSLTGSTWGPILAGAIATAVLTMILAPALRALPITRRLLERRFGDS